MTYIAGPMTGKIEYNFRAFFKAEHDLTDKGHQVINPARIAYDLSFKMKIPISEIPREVFIREDIKYLLLCNTIYMLKGWRRSKGAKLEYGIAEALNYRVLFESKME